MITDAALRQSDFEERFDVVVVGAGLSGLFAAWQAAESGRRVCILEQGNLTVSADGHAVTTSTAGAGRTGGAGEWRRLADHGQVYSSSSYRLQVNRSVGGSLLRYGLPAVWPQKDWFERCAARSGDHDLADRLTLYAKAAGQFTLSHPLDLQAVQPGSGRRQANGRQQASNSRKMTELSSFERLAAACSLNTAQCFDPAALEQLLSRLDALDVQLYTGCRISRAVIRQGRAVGVSGHTVSGRRRGVSFHISAPVVLLAAGGHGTTMLVSELATGPFQPGEHVHTRLESSLAVRFADGSSAGGSVSQNRAADVVTSGLDLYALTAFRATGLKLEKQVNRYLQAGIQLNHSCALPPGRIRKHHRWFDHQVTSSALEPFLIEQFRLARLCFEGGAAAVRLPVRSAGEITSMAELASLSFERMLNRLSGPYGVAELAVFQRHFFGGCRAGQATGSVCHPNGRVRGIDGLYVCAESALGLDHPAPYLLLATLAMHNAAAACPQTGVAQPAEIVADANN